METIINKIEKLENRKKFYLTLLEVANLKSITEFEINWTTPTSISYENKKWDKNFSEQLDDSIDICISELDDSGNNYLKPEHLLLAILRKTNLAKYLLTQLNINLNELIDTLETSILSFKNYYDRPDDCYPFSKVVIEIIDSASIESEKLSLKMYDRHSECITTCDILLAIVKNKNCKTGILLKQIGLSYVIIRNKIIDNQHPYGVKKFKKIEKMLLSRVKTIDKKIFLLNNI